MYFSLITPVDGREREAGHEFAAGPYGAHQWLWRFFPAPEGSRRGFLYRRSDVADIPRFYVVSKQPPNPISPAWSVRTRDYAPKLQAGVRLRFDLRANPVVTITGGGKAQRHDVVMQEKKRLLKERGLERWQDWRSEERPPHYAIVRDTCSEWLQSRSERHGFEVNQATLSVDGYEQHAEKGGLLRFTTVDFGGELTVLDPDAFAGALREGIGHCKGFGCGLLLVRRAG